MRDRLKELIKESSHYVGDDELLLDRITDHLLANGVIVLPYKPVPLVDEGDRVLCPECEKDLMGCYCGYDNTPTVVTCYECGTWIDSTKAVDREEAEKALEERKNGRN